MSKSISIACTDQLLKKTQLLLFKLLDILLVSCGKFYIGPIMLFTARECRKKRLF